MNKLEELKNKMKKAYDEYHEKYVIANNHYDMIIGCLNRMSVSDDENEVERYYDNLIHRSINEYKEKARKSHQYFKIYDKIFREYIEEKRKIGNE